MPQFANLALAPHLLRSIQEEGYTTPTPIQEKAIPPAMEGRDILGCAQTGTGKTAAFALPILHRLHTIGVDKTRRGPAIPRALILSPTRELAAQIGDSFATYGRHAGLSHTVIFGGVSQYHQVRALHRGVDIVIATPGRLMDLMNQRLVILTGVQIFVLDEADRMLDMGFIQPIRHIAAALPKPPAPRQTMLFSATMPKEIAHLAESLLHDPVRVAVNPVASAAPLIVQSAYNVAKGRKSALLEHLIHESKIDRALVFTRTKRGADVVCKRLQDANIPAVAIHGNKAQNFRIKALDNFRSGKARILVATDVAARGLDIDLVSHVFNYDLPFEPESYVHRIGRTGRAGAAGIAIAFFDDDERSLLRDIERLTKKTIPLVELPMFADRPRQLAPGETEDGNAISRSQLQRRRPDSRPANRNPSRQSFDADRDTRRAPHPRGSGGGGFSRGGPSRDNYSSHPRGRSEQAPSGPAPHTNAAGNAPRTNAGTHSAPAHAPKPHTPHATPSAHATHAPKPHAPKAYAPRPHAERPSDRPAPHPHSKPHGKPHASKPHNTPNTPGKPAHAGGSNGSATPHPRAGSHGKPQGNKPGGGAGGGKRQPWHPDTKRRSRPS